MKNKFQRSDFMSFIEFFMQSISTYTVAFPVYHYWSLIWSLGGWNLACSGCWTMGGFGYGIGSRVSGGSVIGYLIKFRFRWNPFFTPNVMKKTWIVLIWAQWDTNLTRVSLEIWGPRNWLFAALHNGEMAWQDHSLLLACKNQLDITKVFTPSVKHTRHFGHFKIQVGQKTYVSDIRAKIWDNGFLNKKYIRASSQKIQWILWAHFFPFPTKFCNRKL